MRVLVGLFWCLMVVAVAAVLAMPGCGPRLKEEDLGTLVFGRENLPGVTDQSYVLPGEPSEPPSGPEGGPTEGEKPDAGREKPAQAAESTQPAGEPDKKPPEGQVPGAKAEERPSAES